LKGAKYGIWRGRLDLGQKGIQLAIGRERPPDKTAHSGADVPRHASKLTCMKVQKSVLVKASLSHRVI
jgi:hypothetical protein